MLSESAERLKVLLITEGTYPYHFGGVSTWCHLLIRDLPEVDFTLMSLIDSPRLKPFYELAPNVRALHPVPLWGVLEHLETRAKLPFWRIRSARRAASESTIQSEFAPLYEAFVEDLLLGKLEPKDLARIVHQMHRFWLAHDYDQAMRSRPIWDTFVRVLTRQFPSVAATQGYPDAEFYLADLSQGFQWLHHMLFPIAVALPATDIAHAAIAGSSTLVAICAKLEQGAAYLFSEHGIYLRETYLMAGSGSNSLFLKLLRLRFARRMTELSYALADQISPCCDYNQRWERLLGAPPERLRTIRYGLDASEFTATPIDVEQAPVVVWVGRVSPVKDLDTLIRAAGVVHQARPDVQFRLFGKPGPEDGEYNRDLLVLRAELGLESAVVFTGFVAKPEIAYRQGTIVVLSSLTEALPFTNLEAMLCGRPIVATNVGGVPEQVSGCGTVVEPRNPQALAEAILDLVSNPEKCVAFGAAAREKALSEFSLRQSSDAYLSSYDRLALRESPLSGSYQLAQSLPSSVVTEESQSLGETSAESIDPVFVTPAEEVETGELNPVVDLVRIADLAARVSQRLPLPIDYLEIAALLESMGVTDGVARRRFGMADTFALAEVVFGWLIRERRVAVTGTHSAVELQSEHVLSSTG